jgi:hypothetical protein
MAEKEKIKKVKQSQGEQNQDKPKDTNITVALIGAGATIIVALISLLSLWIKPNSNIAAVTSTPTFLTSHVDDFSSGTSQWWSILPITNKYWSSTSTIDNNAYRWQITSTQPVFADFESKIPPLADFDLEMTLSRIDNRADSSYGIRFHAGENGEYDLKFDPKYPQQFKLQRLDGNVETKLIDWTVLEIINQSKNKVRILVIGDSIQIFINDKLAGAVNDNTYPSGKIGIFAGFSEGGRTIIIEMSNFKIATPSNP